MKLRSDISPRTFRVFVAILAMAQARKPVTVRGLAKRLGSVWPNSVCRELKVLQKRGLIIVDKEDDVRSQATIRPLRRLELCEENLS